MNRLFPSVCLPANFLLAVCFLAICPAGAEEPEPTALTSDFGGRVSDAQGGPAAGVEVLVYHLATAELFAARTDPSGEYVFHTLPFGYYDLAIRAADGLYVADEVAHISAEGNTFLALRLAGPTPEADLRPFAGANEAPIGRATVIDQRRSGPSFWRSPRGISTAAGGGALLILLLGGGSDPPASPFMPATAGP